MAKSETVEELAEKVHLLSSIDVETLVSRAEWGSIDFTKCKDELRDIRQMVKPLGSLPLRLLPQAAANQIVSELGATIEVIAKIKSFTLSGNAESVRDAIAGEVSQRIPKIYSAIAPHAAYLALYAGDLDKTIQSLEELRVSTTKKVDRFQKNLENSKVEIETIMSTAREAAGNAGVGAFSTDFSDLADKQNKVACHWLITTGILGALSLLAAIVAYFLPLPEDATSAQIVQFTTSKVVALGLLLSATFWSSRQYRALRHQISVNRHRATALTTFQAFVSAARDDSAKDAVLMETTRSIFSIAPSGYLSAQNDTNTQDGLKIVEMIRNAGSGE